MLVASFVARSLGILCLAFFFGGEDAGSEGMNFVFFMYSRW